jgi:hypothetical protein
VTVLRLIGLTTPAEFADWVRLGAEYVRDVTAAMSFSVDGGLDALDERVAAGVTAMREGRTAVPADVARLVAADLLADAAFAGPFCEWTPVWYELALAGPNAVAARRLRRVALRYVRASGVGSVDVPRFSRPRDVLVDGRPATAGLGAGPRGFARRFVLADAILHLEWYVHVAREAGVEVPAELVARTRRESAACWGGPGEADPGVLSPEVRRFQHALFADDEWVRQIDAAYGLDSRLLGLWARLLTDARAALATDGD